MADMNEFLELAHRAGIGTLNSLAIAEALEISTSYVAKLRSGAEPVRPKIRAKLDAMIAAKSNGPEPVDQDIIDQADDAVEPAESLLDQHVRKSTDLEAQLAKQAVPVNPKPISPRDLYTIVPVADGYAVVQNFVAVFRGRSWAEEYADWLNARTN